MNKHCLNLFAFLLILGMVLPSFAQQPERMGGKERCEIPSPENNARRIMKEFKGVFKLTDQDYDKVYELYLKQEKAMMPSQNMNGDMLPRRGGMGGPGGGSGGSFGGGMNRFQMGGGIPPQGGFDMSRDGMPEDMQARMEEMQKEQDYKRKQAAKKLNKKMKKILNKEQYNQWQDWESQRIKKNAVTVLE